MTFRIREVLLQFFCSYSFVAVFDWFKQFKWSKSLIMKTFQSSYDACFFLNKMNKITELFSGGYFLTQSGLPKKIEVDKLKSYLCQFIYEIKFNIKLLRVYNLGLLNQFFSCRCVQLLIGCLNFLLTFKLLAY